MADHQSTGIPNVHPGAEFIYRLHFLYRIFSRKMSQRFKKKKKKANKILYLGIKKKNQKGYHIQ